MDIDKRLKVVLSKNEKIADGILAVIALKGPKCYDDLYRSPPRGAGIQSRKEPKVREELGAKSAVHEALSNLLESKLIKVHRKIPHIPDNIKIYDLTLCGLFVALSFEALQKDELIKKIAENHKEKLPLILGKWDFFEDVKITHFVKARMKEYFYFPPKTIHSSAYSLLAYGLKNKDIKYVRKLINEKFELSMREDLNRHLLFPWLFGIVYHFYVSHADIPYAKGAEFKIEGLDYLDEWVGILLADKELKSYLMSELHRLKEYSNFCSQIAETLKTLIDRYPFYFYSREKHSAKK